MAAATPTFQPIPTLDARAAGRSPSFRRVRTLPTAMLVFGALGAAAAVGVLRSSGSAGGLFGSAARGQDATRSSDLSAPVFMSFAVGDLVTRVEVRTEPGGGATVANLAEGTRVSIGGQVAFGTAFARGVAYWVAAVVDGHTVQGFVPAGAVSLQAGTPPRLAIDGDAASDAVPAAGASAALAPIDRAVDAASADAALTAASADAAPEPAGSAPTTVDIPWLPETIRHWSALLEEAARKHGVAADLLAIIALVESGGHPAARSHVGATGLMQVMPATAADIARQRGIGGFSAAQLTDPAVAIDFGAWYLAQQLTSFGRSDDEDWVKSVELAAAAYNGGPGAAMRFVRGGGLPSETQAYVGWVGGMWRERKDVGSPTYERWMAAGGSVLVDKARVWLSGGGG